MRRGQACSRSWVGDGGAAHPRGRRRRRPHRGEGLRRSVAQISTSATGARGRPRTSPRGSSSAMSCVARSLPRAGPRAVLRSVSWSLSSPTSPVVSALPAGTGKGHLCPATEILGVHRDGAFAEFVVVPAANAWPDPVGLPLSVAALQENFGNAVHSVSVPTIAGRKVLVTGCGPVGLMAIAAARALGRGRYWPPTSAPTGSVWPSRWGRTWRWMPPMLWMPSGRRPKEEGVDVLLEMSGSATAIADGFGLLKPGGRGGAARFAAGADRFRHRRQRHIQGRHHLRHLRSAAVGHLV